ncbi:2-oxoglutarate and iron-dependent oxygenase domain-containing protein [Ramlibacter sp. H39-3-26]|uniref:isopenicillin N synthase family dioxygenase n=1 Tax=Curvibacter soli TaxID=3031331 RepID=UPI0023D9C347|nr:2-oxoglutarate and iron-dependent oxygenase domain-containing protein [Ramlibacter sp. H39-3-26]MDF1486667.1 2-oxoglutarate and iron-dependent oxygenase domain-containing protein [Ramlibacter sp. H39-3-26]
MSIPVIDLADALAPGGARSAAVAAQVRAAGTASGFFYVRNHGVPAALAEAQYALARRFFELPLADKQAIDLHRSPSMRGYEAIGAQTLGAGARPDLKESFYCGLEYAPDHPYVRRGYHSYGSNQWPAALPEMAAQCAAYTAALLALAQRLMQLMALSLDLPEGYFDHTHGNPMVTLRLLRYPPHPRDADERTFGAGAHTDWGAITILAQDALGGLEVCMPGGAWVAAPPMEGSFVVNLGDMIPRWTNGRYHSNPHRVRNLHSHGAPRYSIPFFYSPDYEARVEPVPTCVLPGAAPRYEACTVGEHLRDMYRKTYGLGNAGAAMA